MSLYDDVYGDGPAATPTGGGAWTTDMVTQRIRTEARKKGIDPELAVAVATQESALNPSAVGDNGQGLGVFQLHAGAAQDAGIDPRFRHEPSLNILGGVTYLKQKLDQSKGNVEQALLRYNGGGDPNYVQNVMRHYPGQQRPQAQAQAPASPGILTRAARFLSPGSVEAATTGAGDLYQQVYGSAPPAQPAREAPESPQAPAAAVAAPPAPPTATSTPEQDAAYRASRGQQEPMPGGVAPPAAPAPAAAPGANLERFNALPSITQLTPADRAGKQRLFMSLDPASQEEFLQSEEPPAPPALPAAPAPAAARRPGQASDMVIDIVKPSTPAPKSPYLGIEPLDEGGVERALAARTPDNPIVGIEGRPFGTIIPPDMAVPPAGGGPRPSQVEPPLEESLTAPSTMIPLLMPGAGIKAAGPLLRNAPEAVSRLIRPAAEAISQTLGYGTGRTIETGEVPSAGELATTLGTTAVLGGAMEQAVPLVAKVGNAARGVLKPASQKIVDLGERYGVRLSYGDVTQGAAIPKVEASLEAIPGSGAGRMRIGQQADVTALGERLQAQGQAEMRATPWRDLSSVQAAARGTGSRAKEARALLAEIDDAGDDWGRVIQSSGKLNLWQDRQRSSQLYDRVERFAQPLGNMRLPQTTKAIDDAIALANADVLPSPEVKREVLGALGRVRAEISPTAAPPQPSMGVRNPLTGRLQAQPMTQSTTIPDTTYGRMRGLRSALGDLQREAAEPAVARYLGGVKSALEEDMQAFATKSNVPELTRAAREADNFYRTRVVKYREGLLAQAIEKDLPDEIYGKFVRQGADRAQYFYNGLDQKGQAAVRYGMVEEALKKAASPAHPDVFSPARFVGEMRRVQDASGVFFKGQPQWEINGVTRLMQHAQRAGQYAENPPTGLRAGVGGLVLGAGWASAPAAIGGLLSAQGLRLLLMTRPGRNFLLAASDMQPGSSALQRHLDAFLRKTPAAAGPLGAAVRAPEETAQR